MKIISSIMLAFAIVLSSLTVVYAEDDMAFKCADTSGDGVINAEDALEVLKYAARLSESFSTEAVVDEGYVVGDVTGDNNINAEDALDILKYAAKLIDSFDIDPNQAGNSVDKMRAELLENIESDVTLGAYKGIEVEVEAVVVTEEEIQDYINEDLEYYGTCEEIKEGVVAVGDSLNIDYAGTIDGVVIENGSEEGAEITIGSGSFIDGFEDALVGKNIGETVLINVTFPNDYYDDLAGKQAEFTVTINYKYGDIIPAELTDALVRQMGYGEEVTTVEEYKQLVRVALEESAKESQKSIVFNEILDKLVTLSTVNNYSDPSLSVDVLFEEEIAYMKAYAESYSYSYEEFVSLYTGMTVEEYEAVLRDDIIFYVDQIMIYRAIAKAENIIISQEEYEAELAMYSADYESSGCQSVEEFEELYGMQVYEFMVYDQVEAMLYESAIINMK